MEKAFDNGLYIKLQKEKILERVEMFENKLYLEMGGKLFDDLHASRVLPGFESDVKINLLTSMKDDVEIVVCVNANDIDKNKIRADFGITYDNEVLRLIDNFRSLGLYVSSVVITLFNEQPRVKKFATMLERRGEKVYFHTFTKGYPNDVDTIVSEEGYGKNEYIKTTKRIVVVTAPGPNSGKLATCLSQLYHDYKLGIKSGYSKYETFPVWNLPLKHPVNVAYEAATADIGDINMIDSYYFNEYGKVAVNYNRDLSVFPVLKNILKKITGKDVYKSPTEMGVNVIGNAIISDEIAQKASKQEILRRYYNYLVAYKKGLATQDSVCRVKMLLSELEIDDKIIPAIDFARKTKENSGKECVALELQTGEIVVGKDKGFLSATGAMILNALKVLAGISDDIDLLAETILTPILSLKEKVLKEKKSCLTLFDVLIALSISSATNMLAKKCLEKISLLFQCNAHSTAILADQEENTLKRLGINITSEAFFPNKALFNN